MSDTKRIQAQIGNMQDIVNSISNSSDPHLRQEVERLQQQIKGMKAELASRKKAQVCPKCGKVH